MAEVVGGSRDGLAMEEILDSMGTIGGVVQTVMHMVVRGWLLG